MDLWQKTKYQKKQQQQNVSSSSSKNNDKVLNNVKFYMTATLHRQ